MTIANTQLSPSSSEEIETPQFVALPAYTERPVVRGKFLFTGKEKFWIKGVTYGTFRPQQGGGVAVPRDD